MLDIPEVLISSDMASITPNSSDILDPEYLSYVLDTSLVKNQYEKLVTLRNQKVHDTLPPGHAFKFASWIDALASIVIPIPSLTEQKIIYEEHKKTRLALKNSNRALRKKDREIFEKRKTELSDKAIKMNDSIAQLIHSLSPRLSGINSVIRSMLRRGEEDELGFNKKDLIESDIEEMGTESIQEALESLLKDQQVCMELMTKWSELSQRAINREDFESTEMASFFNDIKNEFRRFAFKIKTFIPEGTIAEIDRKIFKEVITNIIRNASIHAFKKPQKKDQINFSIETQGTDIIIDYWNNGTKFPKEITKSEFLSIGDPNMAVGGGGHGGSLINYFCENHRGEFNIIRSDYPIHFRFSFPVIQKFKSDVLPVSAAETNPLDVLSVSAAETNHLIQKYKIHSCPESYTYTKTKYITFRTPPHGEMIDVYKIKKIITLQRKEINAVFHLPSLETLKEIYGLKDSELDRLIAYIRKNPFKKNKRFYFLSRHQVLPSPFFPSEYKTDPEYYSFDQLLGNDKNDPKTEE
jgi:signal transduction histidine kinase